MEFVNSWNDSTRADSYAKLEFPGTYYLAYRDLPQIICDHVKGNSALDFGCGTGRSTRFLNKYGFDTIGIDIAEDMIKRARQFEPNGDYRLIEDGDLSQFKDSTYDLVLSVFTFDNISTKEKKITLFRDLGRLLKNRGRIINLVSAPEIYMNEWASFSTKDFPENKYTTSGDKVKIIMKDVEDKRPVEDIIWRDEDYREVFTLAGLELIKTHKPLAGNNEPYEWINETKIAPWAIYVLKRNSFSRSTRINT